MYNDYRYRDYRYNRESRNARRVGRTISYGARMNGEKRISYTDIVVELLSRLVSFLRSDAFSAGFIGVSILLVIGIVGGLEFGLLSLYDGGIYSALILTAVSVLIYLNKKED